MSDTEPRHRSNRLAGETSPYLLQHAHNPVDWFPWGPEALERARAEDRPIFLSIGYAACHWCHVMERESFEDEETAALLNREFVAIKVDREERPDLDDVYMAAVQAMTGSGGWPMSVFLTPELDPFFGGTYFPPADHNGLPGFRRVLDAVAEAYRSRRDEIATQGRRLSAHLRERLEVPAGDRDPQRLQLDGAVRTLAASFDARHGGFGGAPKFPAPMTLEFLLRAWRRSRDPQTLAMVTTTLDAMARGGIHDQVGGGFARYATDGIWLVPHFEKMLYDNALLAHAYLEAWRATGEERYRDVVESTLAFVIRELQTPDGGFASALDADSEGEEGRFYVWTDADVRSTLADAGLRPDEVEALVAHWGVTPVGNWEGRTILTASAQPPPRISWSRVAAPCSRPGGSGCVRLATRSSSRPGTGSCCGRWPGRQPRSAPSRWPGRRSGWWPSSATSSSDPMAACGGRRVTGAATPPASSRTTPAWLTGSSRPTRRPDVPRTCASHTRSWSGPSPTSGTRNQEASGTPRRRMTASLRDRAR